MLEIIIYNIVFWSALIFVGRVFESAMQYSIDNYDKFNNKG